MDQKQKEIMINFITILLIGFAVSFVLLESLNIANRLKSLFKIPLYEINTKGIKKIFDCSYCQYFWITNLISLPLCIFVLPQIPQITMIIVCINIFYAEQMNKIYKFMDKKKFDLGEELEVLVYSIENKIRKETNLGVFTKQEQGILFEAYKKLSGTIPSKNCAGCFIGIKKSLTNWLNMYPKPIELPKFTDQQSKDLANSLKDTKTEGVTFVDKVQEKPKAIRKPRLQKDGWTRIVHIESLGIDGKLVNVKIGDREVSAIYTTSYDGEKYTFIDQNGNDCSEWEGTPTHFKLIN